MDKDDFEVCGLLVPGEYVPWMFRPLGMRVSSVYRLGFQYRKGKSIAVPMDAECRVRNVRVETSRGCTVQKSPHDDA